MVLRLPPQSETQLKQEFTALKADPSSYLGSVDDYDEFSIWTCTVNGDPNARGYWIGKLPSYYGYLIVREGMTDAAHMAWQKSRHFHRCYFDTTQNAIVPPESVPEDERFSACGNAQRWLLVMHPVPSTHPQGACPASEAVSPRSLIRVR
jgi:hypothetical protein